MTLHDQHHITDLLTIDQIADALLKLKIPKAGFVPNLHIQNSAAAPQVSSKTIIAPISTVLFAPKDHVTSSTYEGYVHNTYIPDGTHYVDTTPTSRGYAVLMSAPSEATCAVLGGIMALRMSVNGASAIIVDGRVRDLAELRNLNIPVWSTGTSVVGAGEGTKVWAKDVPIRFGDVTVDPGDIICADPTEQGVVVVPKDLVDKVLELCSRLTAADEKVIEDVRSGSTVQEAFKKHRSSL